MPVPTPEEKSLEYGVKKLAKPRNQTAEPLEPIDTRSSVSPIFEASREEAKIEPALPVEDAIVLPVEEAIAHPPLYPTEQYRDLGIQTCKGCGEKFRTGMYGEAICAIDKDDCPRA